MYHGNKLNQGIVIKLKADTWNIFVILSPYLTVYRPILGAILKKHNVQCRKRGAIYMPKCGFLNGLHAHQNLQWTYCSSDTADGSNVKHKHKIFISIIVIKLQTI